ncbi:MAG: YkgJ family cysteine cluster protein [Polyangiaceae bacterium]
MSLCASCGLCCTGELFASIEVLPEETPRIEAKRLPIVRETGRAKIPQPCPAHDGTCSIYADRPRACATFRCAPLLAVEAGEASFPEAEARLARAKRLAASVRARVPGRGALFRDLESLVVDTPEWRRDNAALVMDIAVLRALLDRIRGD